MRFLAICGNHQRDKVLTAVKMSVLVFWVIMLMMATLVSVYLHSITVQ
jgi:hypothetical protein